MKPAETVSRSPLDKPLGELTEEDIAQLTREDCRNYLQKKGMRRPSWNKWQAVQQVISLKTLLEARPDSGDTGIRQKTAASCAEPDNPPAVESASGTDSLSDRSKDPQQSAVSGDVSSHRPASGNGSFPIDSNGISPRTTLIEWPPASQMTIFYDGKVNVYEGVSLEKARLIMQLAGSPNNCCSPFEVPPFATSYQETQAFVSRLPSDACRANGRPSSPTMLGVMNSASTHQQTGKMSQLYRETNEERKMLLEIDYDGPTNRQASLQRYLEKRKDRGRFKNKRKTGGSSSSSLEIYVNQHLKGGQTSNGQSRSGTCSPTQPRLHHAPTRCSSVESQAKNSCLPVDLNDDVHLDAKSKSGPKGESISDSGKFTTEAADERGMAASSSSLLSWSCYLIVSFRLQKTYVGVTNNFPRRLKQHNGEYKGGAKASRAGRPWACACIIHGFKGRSEACAFESKWKSFSRALSRKRKARDMSEQAEDERLLLLLDHRKAALCRVQASLDCSHLEINWQLDFSIVE